MKSKNRLDYLIQIKSKPLIGYLIISAFYFFGIIGISFWDSEWFIEKTAFNLLLSFIILMIYQQTYSWKLFASFLFCYFVGFLAEFLGVNFGLIFGEYEYPPTLGPQLGGVPIIIGINWFIITFCIWAFFARFNWPILLKIIIAIISTVFLDILIEPVAIALNFWQWENSVIPLQNYMGWAGIAATIFIVFALLRIPVKNRISTHLLLWQFVFFLVLNILSKNSVF